MTPTLDPGQVRQWLTTLHCGAPGLINICATDQWSGEHFTTDDAGINAAVAYVQKLDRERRAGIYARSTTMRHAPKKWKRGGADISLSFPGFWADIDIDGPGHAHEICAPDCAKGHTTHVVHPLPPNLDEAKRVITEAGLPEPTLIIHSGGGLYPWWLLDEPHIVTDDDLADIGMLSARWQHALGAGAARLGYHYGTGVGDLARVLRIPGTINRKEGLARPCHVIEAAGTTYSLDELGILLFSIDLPDLPTAQPAAQPPPRPATISRTDGTIGPFDALAESCQWRDLLEPAGFYYVRSEADGAELWKYSGSSASSQYSVRAWPHVLVNHSETTPLPVGHGNRLTHGRVFAALHHGGTNPDALSRAGKDLYAAAVGSLAASSAARALPAHILGHIRQRCVPDRPSYAPVNGQAVPGYLAPHPADDAAYRPDEETEPDGQMETDGQDGQEDWEKGPVRRRGLLPEEFWNARPVLQHIRQAAHARNRSGDLVLGGLLARLSSVLPPELKADTGVGSPASANMFVILLGPSGSGKSSAAWIPRELLDPPPHLDYLDELPLGSGEGIAEAYMGEKTVETGEIYRGGPKKGDPKTETIRAQVRHNALFYADEGESLTKQLFGRTGATIGESIRRAWTGGTIGQFNGNKINTRVIASGSYSLGLVVGFQPETAMPLLEDAAAGTPQRFLWVSSTDPSIPEDPAAWPGALDLKLIRQGFGPKPRIRFAPTLMRAIRDDDRARATGTVKLPPLDSHKPLMLVKLAVLLAILDDRLDVTEEDWQLALGIWDTSCELRDYLLEYGARQLAEAAEQKTRAHVDREVRAHAAKASVDRDIERVARRIAKRVHDAHGMTQGALKKDTASRDRGWLAAAIDYAESRDWVVTEGDQVLPGDSRPS